MAHEISVRANGKAEMAYVGDTPWHGLGQPLTKEASIGVWAHEAGMDWEAKTAPVFFDPHQDEEEEDRNTELMEIPGHKVIYRSDTEAPLSIMSSDYNIVQPREVLEFFRDITEQGGWHIHTAGVLRGGRKLWAMASNGESAAVGARGADKINQNILLATSLDGSMKTIAALTAVRVVCANTLSLALRSNGEKIQISHRSIFDAQAIKRALGVSVATFDSFMEQAREMADTPVKLDEALETLRTIFGAPAAKAVPSTAWMGALKDLGNQPVIPDEEDAKESRSVSRVLELFSGAGRGADYKTAKGTRWGLFNAITEHVDHEMGRSRDTGLDSAWFGRGNGFKQKALELLTA